MKMELDIWKGDWGLASVDIDCLQLVTYCKFAGAVVQINLKNNVLNAPNWQLPVFKHYKQKFSTFDDVTVYLMKKNLSPDFGLDQKQKADIVAFTAYLKDFLYPAILYVWWLDERNRTNLTRKWYAKTLPFPLNLFLPDRYHKKAEEKVESLFCHIENEQVLEAEIFDRAVQCLTSISHRLGNQEFMFGSNPTSIDATLFAYLAPLVKVPFPNSKLKNQVLGFNNLLKYVTRISQRYFAAENQAYEAQRLKEQSNDGFREINTFPHKRRNQILATGFAFIAMAGYAISTGLLQIPPKWYRRSRTVRIPITQIE